MEINKVISKLKGGGGGGVRIASDLINLLKSS